MRTACMASCRFQCSQSESARSLFTLYCALVKKDPTHPHQSLVGHLKSCYGPAASCDSNRMGNDQHIRAVHAAVSWWLMFLMVADAWKDPDTSQQWLQY